MKNLNDFIGSAGGSATVAGSVVPLFTNGEARLSIEGRDYVRTGFESTDGTFPPNNVSAASRYFYDATYTGMETCAVIPGNSLYSVHRNKNNSAYYLLKWDVDTATIETVGPTSPHSNNSRVHAGHGRVFIARSSSDATIYEYDPVTLTQVGTYTVGDFNLPDSVTHLYALCEYGDNLLVIPNNRRAYQVDPVTLQWINGSDIIDLSAETNYTTGATFVPFGSSVAEGNLWTVEGRSSDVLRRINSEGLVVLPQTTIQLYAENVSYDPVRNKLYMSIGSGTNAGRIYEYSLVFSITETVHETGVLYYICTGGTA